MTKLATYSIKLKRWNKKQRNIYENNKIKSIVIPDKIQWWYHEKSMRLLSAVFVNLSIDKENTALSHSRFMRVIDLSLEKCNDYRPFMALISSKCLGVKKTNPDLNIL